MSFTLDFRVESIGELASGLNGGVVPWKGGL